jgi:hypothetical protein
MSYANIISYHDVTKQLNLLTHVLSEDKRPIAIMIAAGCPVSISMDGEPLIPDISGLTRSIIDSFQDEPNSLLSKVLQTLKTEIEYPTIEDILSYLRLLQQIPMSGKIHDVANDSITELEESICELIEEKVNIDLTGRETPYHKLAYWINSINREYPVEIFTTNYDLLMEQALEECNVPYFDGFVGAKKAFFDIRTIEGNKLPNSWTRLWKIHGSINWKIDKTNQTIWRGSPGKGCKLIHPSHLKYDQSRKMPYLVMMDQLKRFFKQPSATLITCGYSYKDQHINELLSQTLQANPNSLLYGLQYDVLENYQEAREMALSRSNFMLFAKDRAIVGKKEKEWKSDAHTVEMKDPLSIFELGDFQNFASYIEGILNHDWSNKK